ncbi:3-hydroxyacyl-CoA dehydrogenase family protein [Streptomyces sp. NPDC005373]|uniref:3-hydroxyacyl-CoA dehydrogenase family protein n=1 Tax=Streptomyces sp. NPDC005373 TaxID=3156879 RepID=UPI0033A0F02A
MKVAVLGLGTMGRSIAGLCAAQGCDVTGTDPHADGVEEQIERIIADVLRDAPSGSLARATRVRMATSVSAAVDGSDLVIEALPESAELKVRVLRPLFAEAPERLVFTNTSALPVDFLSDQLGHPPGFLGVHFFNPAHIVRGVEIIPAEATAAWAVTTTHRLLGQLGKSAVAVRSSPGFVGNRLQLALFAEAARCVDEGLATPEEVDEIVRTTFGFRLACYGPFTIADMAGLDVFHAILENLHQHFGPRFEPPSGLRDRVRAGRLGLKSGAGYGTYPAAEAESLEADRNTRYQAVIAAADSPTDAK